MSLSEFSLIESYFKNCGLSAYPAKLGIGDDAAVLEPPENKHLVMTMDTLIEGVHFPQKTAAEDIAWKSLAVNLSDLAAMAATPGWFLLSLSLPDSNPDWLKSFSQGLRQCAERYSIQLIGGDTCKGALSISIQATGFVAAGKEVRRDTAIIGEKIIVSGELGNAALGLADLQSDITLPEDLRQRCLYALKRPEPRLELSPLLQQYATSAIDLSDGLIGDLGHILRQSDVGAVINKHQLPVCDWIKQANQYQYAISSGDDYELCFTLPAQLMSEISVWNNNQNNCRLTCIGEICESGFNMIDENNSIDLNSATGYQHFV